MSLNSERWQWPVAVLVCLPLYYLCLSLFTDWALSIALAFTPGSFGLQKFPYLSRKSTGLIQLSLADLVIFIIHQPGLRVHSWISGRIYTVWQTQKSRPDVFWRDLTGEHVTIIGHMPRGSAGARLWLLRSNYNYWFIATDAKGGIDRDFWAMQRWSLREPRVFLSTGTEEILVLDGTTWMWVRPAGLERAAGLPDDMYRPHLLCIGDQQIAAMQTSLSPKRLTATWLTVFSERAALATSLCAEQLFSQLPPLDTETIVNLKFLDCDANSIAIAMTVDNQYFGILLVDRKGTVLHRHRNEDSAQWLVDEGLCAGGYLFVKVRIGEATYLVSLEDGTVVAQKAVSRNTRLVCQRRDTMLVWGDDTITALDYLLHTDPSFALQDCQLSHLTQPYVPPNSAFTYWHEDSDGFVGILWPKQSSQIRPWSAFEKQPVAPLVRIDWQGRIDTEFNPGYLLEELGRQRA